MKKVTVTWLDNEKQIPNVGIAKKGEDIPMPEDMAKVFIEQKKAKLPSKSKPKKED